MTNAIIPASPEIDLVPLSLFSQRHAEGWRMVPGFPLQPGDYAVTMRAPGWIPPKRNLSVASQHRNKVTAEKRRAARKLAEAG